MKVLHAAALLRPPQGIVNQMRWEYESANELDIDWAVQLYCPKGWMQPEPFVKEAKCVKAGDPSRGSASDWVRFRYSYYLWLMSQIDNYDVFILRYYVHDPFQLMFIKRCPKPVYLVHHTLEGPELSSSGALSAKMRAVLDDLIGRPALRAVAGTIGVTQEIINYEFRRAGITAKQGLLYPNGIKFDQPPVRDLRSAVPELLFVSGEFVPWHGLDLLLDSIEQNDAEFKLHLVGNVYEPDLTRARADGRIIVHGPKSSSEIRKIAETCWLGLSSFGLHRKKMTEACTLKVREYLMMGLRVYGGHRDVIQDNNSFISCGPADIKDILHFALEQEVSRELVAKAASSSICKTMLLSRLLHDLEIDVRMRDQNLRSPI